MKTSSKPTRASGASWEYNSTTTTAGVIEIATIEEAVAGISNTTAISPQTLQSRLVTYGGDYEVVIPNASGAINLDFSLGNIFDIAAVGHIGPFTESNITQSRMGSLRIVNTTGSTINITWTGIYIVAGTPATLAGNGILWAPLGAML